MYYSTFFLFLVFVVLIDLVFVVFIFILFTIICVVCYIFLLVFIRIFFCFISYAHFFVVFFSANLYKEKLLGYVLQKSYGNEELCFVRVAWTTKFGNFYTRFKFKVDVVFGPQLNISYMILKLVSNCI